MTKYTFAIDGHEDEYYRAFDVKRLFAGPIYSEDVKLAMRVVKDEREMRMLVFKNDAVKRRRKVGAMDQVLKVLGRCSDRFPEMQKEIFE